MLEKRVIGLATAALTRRSESSVVLPGTGFRGGERLLRSVARCRSGTFESADAFNMPPRGRREGRDSLICAGKDIEELPGAVRFHSEHCPATQQFAHAGGTTIPSPECQFSGLECAPKVLRPNWQGMRWAG